MIPYFSQKNTASVKLNRSRDDHESLIEYVVSDGDSGMHAVIRPEVGEIPYIGHTAQCLLGCKDTALTDIARVIDLVNPSAHGRSELSGSIYDAMYRIGICS